MNTYQEKLFETTNSLLKGLKAEQAKRISQENCDSLSLYFAQGALRSAADKLDETVSEFQAVQIMNDQVVACNSQSDCLINTAALTDKSTKKSAVLTQKSAEDIQLASNAISHLSADIGSALNIVFAADYGTDIAEMTKDVNKYVRETAYSAEQTAQLALEAATAVAEVTPGQIKSSTSQTSKVIKSFAKDTLNNIQLLNSQKESETATLAVRLKSEKLAGGTLKSAESFTESAQTSFRACNTEMNQGFTVEPVGSDRISVSFENKDTGFSGGEIPEKVEGHFVVLVKANKRDTFNPVTARVLFESFKERFYPLTTHKGETVTVEVDADGETVKTGARYVAYLYTEYSNGYKKFVDDQNDQLSSSSVSFVLQQPLPDVTNPVIVEKANGRASKVTVDLNNRLPDDAELRLIFVRSNADESGAVLIDGDQQYANGAQHQVYDPTVITAAIAETIAMSGYLTADNISGNQFEFLLPEDLTDNFSKPVIAGVEYRLAILLTSSSAENMAEFASAVDFPAVDVNEAGNAKGVDGKQESAKSGKNTRGKAKK